MRVTAIMSSFDKSNETRDPGLDYLLMRDWSSVTQYSNMDILEEDLKWLANKGYKILRLDCKNISSGEEIIKAIDAQMNLVSMHSYNLDAFLDGLRDVKITEQGMVVAFFNSDSLFPITFHGGKNYFLNVLHCLDIQSARSMLIGERLIVLVQTNDPTISIGHINNRCAKWNRKERLFKVRNVNAQDIKRYDIN